MAAAARAGEGQGGVAGVNGQGDTEVGGLRCPRPLSPKHARPPCMCGRTWRSWH